MATLQNRRAPWGLIAGIVLHGLWGVMILLEPANAKPVTPLAHLNDAIPNHLIRAFILIGVTVSAWVGLYYEDSMAGLWCLLPQQAVLTFSALGGIEAVCKQQYPDGYQAPWHFILADQSVHMVVAVLHTLNILEVHAPFFWGKVSSAGWWLSLLRRK